MEIVYSEVVPWSQPLEFELPSCRRVPSVYRRAARVWCTRCLTAVDRMC